MATTGQPVVYAPVVSTSPLQQHGVPTAGGVMMVPIVYAYAVVGHAQPVPNKWSNILDPQLWGVLQAAQKFTIRQHMKLLPKQCCVCPPCVKQENTYSVYVGNSQDAEAEVLRIDEVSDDWNRCCCAPYHPLRLEVRQYVPMPGDSTGSDYKHISQDVGNDWNRFSGNARDRQQYLRDYYRNQPVLMSMVRDDGLRCCYKCPCKMLGCFVCAQCCQDGMHLYAGQVQDAPEGEKGRPYNLNQENLVGSVIQPVYGGWCWPTLHLRGENANDTDEPFGKVEGPCCFGGCSEFCFDFKFSTSRFNSERKTGDLGTIIKKKPQSLAGAFRELMSDADVYTIQFNEGISASEKATILTAQVFADYMYFDGNTEKCKNADEGIYIYCWYCSIIGKIIPCCLFIPKNR